MDYLVEMTLADSARSRTLEEGRVLIEQYIVPTLELCRKLVQQGKIVAGGPVSATIALTLVVRVESVQELDEVVEALPIWPRMLTTVTPLTSFEGRLAALAPRLAGIKARLAAGGSSQVRA
jgi:hypothetical protein